MLRRDRGRDLKEQFICFFDYHRDIYGKLFQNFDGIGTSKPNVVEGYKRGELCLGVGVTVSGGDGRSVYAFFKRDSRREINRVRVGRDNPNDSHPWAKDQQFSVLVNNVKVLQGPEAFVPSVVWLETTVKRESFGPALLYRSLVKGIVERFPIPSDREIYVPQRADLLDSSLYSDSKSQVIESGPEVVDSIACRREEFIGEGYLQAKHILEMLRIRIFPCFGLGSVQVGREPEKSRNSLFEISDVLVGPINL